jgi:glycosyltransferase involved in cell wall biosynthesis
LNILHVGKYFPPFRGGLELYLRDLVDAIGEVGVSSALLVHRHDRSVRTVDDTVVLGGRPVHVVRAGTWFTLLFAPVSPAFPLQLRRLIAWARPDLLHLHLPNPSAFWALLLPSARRLPWVVHWHADVITAAHGWPMKLAYALYRPFERAVLKRAQAIFVTSAAYLQSSQPLQPWKPKCRVVPLGLEAGRLRRAACTVAAERNEYQPRQGLRVLAVGRLTYYKGFHNLLQAAAQVDTLRVDLVGDGDQAADLRTLAESLHLRERVAFHGSVDESTLARLMSRCDCLCLPSIERTEAFGMVLLEAMSFGKATVVSDVEGSGMGWVVEHGVTGLKVPPADADALAAAFRRLDRDRKALQTMGVRGRAKFEQLFEIKRSAKGVVDTYKGVLSHTAPIADRANP